MADAVVSFAIEKLSQIVTQQLNIRTGVKDGVKFLKRELAYLLTYVKAAETQEESDPIRLWIDDVKEVANEAVILVERFSAQQPEHAAPEQGGVLHRMRSCFCICKKEATLFDIGNQIESLKKRIDQIKIRRTECGIIIAAPTVKQRKRALLRAASFDHEEDVVGFENHIRTLLDEHVKKGPSLGLISIHGMGGLGKSTLASKLYHSSQLSHFKRRAWVCVTEDYDISHVLRKLINCFHFQRDEQESLNKMEDFALLGHLRKILEDGDHYLAVIDDIWDVKVWEKIKNAFPDKMNGSRVIITTRNKTVAEGVDDTCFVYKLNFLSKDESWQLFCKRAKPTPNLETLGEEMVNKCGGLPLAIVILSGLLLQNKTYTFWSLVNDHPWRNLKGKFPEIQEILNLSYDDLSPQMRQCFLYLARYPEDHDIDVFKLKLLWIAEEFISEADEEDGVDMEDVAEDCVNELINRNMIQTHIQSAEGQVLVCRVHDLVRDLAIKKAKERKVLGIFDSSKQHQNPILLLRGQTRHAIFKGFGEYLKLLGPNSDEYMLRSLALSTGTDKLELEVEEVKLIYTRFIYLNVLDMTSVLESNLELPKEVGDLILLKFLGLMGSFRLVVIPPSIRNLKRLQTFCGYSFYTSYRFPRDMLELRELRHLIFPNYTMDLKICSDQTKIQTINKIWYKEWIHIDTINFTNLHTLVIEVEVIDGYEGEKREYSFESIANLTNLRALKLSCRDGVISTIQPLSFCKHLKRVMVIGEIKDVAELRFLPDAVTELTLESTRFTEDPMPTLGSMSNLIALRLAQEAYKGRKMVCSADEFPCLQYLQLQDMFPSLQEFQVDDGALLSLKAFKLWVPQAMATIPQQIRSLPPPPDFWRHLYSCESDATDASCVIC